MGCLFLKEENDYIRNNRYGFISYVATAMPFRKQGVATSLLKHAEIIAKEKHLTYLELTRANFRTDVHQFFLNYGFSKKKTTVFIKEMNQCE